MTQIRRVALLGGTFDPVHNGHLHVARAALARFAFDEVRFLPAPAAPHKSAGACLPIARRVELLELAIAGEPRFAIERHEVEPGGTRYTIDTLSALAAREPDVRWFFLIGGDSLADLPGWRRAAELVERCTFITVPRDPAVDRARLLAPAAAALSPAQVAKLRCHFLEVEPLPVSSTEIRARLKAGTALAGLVPPAVGRALAAGA